MKRRSRWLAALIICPLTVHPFAAHAGSMERVLAKLAPEERAHQACVILGMKKIRKHSKLRHADRMQTSILSPATFDGTHVVGKGAAVRADHHWYRMTFDCKVTEDQMKATAFSYEVGNEIPPEEWDDIGLWP